MKLVVLTTNTIHHTYFINEISKLVDDVHVVYETRRLAKPYVTGPFYEEEQKRFEKRSFHPSTQSPPKRVKVYNSCNDTDCLNHITEISPDIIISFGTGHLDEKVYSLARICALNIHRGYISEYRGLDSDFWALYNKEFDKIGVAIHYLNPELDTGPVVKQETINVEDKFEIYHLRYITTLLATKMMREIISDILITNERPFAIPQEKIGKYYSAMPLKEKRQAKKNLDSHFSEKSCGATILLYHGITDSVSQGVENFSNKHVEQSEFRNQMKYLREKLNPVSLRQMVKLLCEGDKIPSGTVAVTFDDSYKNVYDLAIPILEEYSIPMTFFVATGMIETENKYWVDYLEHIIAHSTFREITVELNETKTYQLNTDEEKVNCIIEIKKFLKESTPRTRTKVMKNIEKQTACETKMFSKNYENLSWDEVREMDKSPLCEIGGHSVNHEILSYLEDEQLEYEILQCLEDLRTNLGHEVDLFSYPEGQEKHYNQKVIKKLKDHGVMICPSAIHGTNCLGEDPFNLKRIMVNFMETSFPYGDK